MFTKSDFVAYFDQVSNAERRVLQKIDDLLGLMKGDAITVPLEEIKSDAARHLRIFEYAGKIVTETRTDAEASADLRPTGRG
jgi:hypothetical protein